MLYVTLASEIRVAAMLVLLDTNVKRPPEACNSYND
jgi:hypothetical protein